MTYVHPHTYINKQIFPIFNCVTPESVLLANCHYDDYYNYDDDYYYCREDKHDILAVCDWSQKMAFYQLNGRQVCRVVT